jgi:regulator of protease activity HflC (stomatin/prohibitin superfamily)
MIGIKVALFGVAVVCASLALGRVLLSVFRRARGRPDAPWRAVAALGVPALAAAALASSIWVVPDGFAGIRVHALRGPRPGVLAAGVHLLTPGLERIQAYDLRDRVFSAGDTRQKAEAFTAQSKEGLRVGLAVSVRWRLDPARLESVHRSLPADVGGEVVGPRVVSVFREVLPQFLVREVFSSRRQDVRDKAAEQIASVLAPDGIVVKEVLLQDVTLPAEYARGLEALLLKEQENERMEFDLQIKQKQVRQAELEADAMKARQVKAAEAQAQVTVLAAKAEADAMQHTLPLKQKQIEQKRLEAEAEAEKSRILSEAEAHRIRVKAGADSERLRLEAAVLKDNPLLIQKIVAERLSDKMQIMMVPMDGRNFFANDIFRGALSGASEAPMLEDSTLTKKASARR